MDEVFRQEQPHRPDELYAFIDDTGVPLTTKETVGRDGKGEDGSGRSIPCGHRTSTSNPGSGVTIDRANCASLSPHAAIRSTAMTAYSAPSAQSRVSSPVFSIALCELDKPQTIS